MWRHWSALCNGGQETAFSARCDYKELIAKRRPDTGSICSIGWTIDPVRSATCS
ncbi:hypothetical protein CERZMDRAFT_89645 [Cercospora zeae-maydis SCOH1-5]|uniref:Uncharacterized protein n=1 Tax=Cercospora zeae-maydis SCOH1-5 TaxID=717836 RepID=A0A6A6FX06_9PEZI|nr:hypothetical protein CERZMDRAFT_89645 [Cercospora zeae-maydis SCOH1-5]